MRTAAPIAIVTDGLWRKSVSAVRALGTAGYRVCVLGDTRLSPGLYSRHTSVRFRGPVAADDPDGFGATLLRAVDAIRGRPAALLPMEDATCEWVLMNGGALPPNVRWLLPPRAAFEITRDKGRTAELAQELGIRTPRTHAPGSVGELRELIATVDISGFVVKPRTGAGSAGMIYGAAIVRTDLERHWETYGPLLLQQRIPAEGTAYGVSALFDRAGRECAAFAHRRLREYPVTGGPSTRRESVGLDALHEHTGRLLSALDWRGVAMVEWKVDPGTGDPLLLEVNPRFWGSLALPVRAGVAFPTLYADAALGRPLPVVRPEYPAGVQSRWLIPGDILRYVSQPRQERESLREFFKGALSESEEFDVTDVRGSLACALCPALLAARPKYWRYLRR